MKIVECFGRFFIFYAQLEMYYKYSFGTRPEAEAKLRAIRMAGIKGQQFKRYSEVINEPDPVYS